MTSIIDDLKKILAAERVLSEHEHLVTYAQDGTAVLHQMPACVVFPITTEEVARGDSIRLSE